MSGENNTVNFDAAVEKTLEQRKATEYLRNRDCEMLYTLSGHLEENIQLHNVLNEINKKIADIQGKLKTPKPRTKGGMLAVGIISLILGIAGAVIWFMMNLPSLIMMTIIIASGVFALGGIAFIISSIITVSVARKKWRAFIANAKTELALEQNNANRARENINNYWNNTVQVYLNEIVPTRFPKTYATDYVAVSGILRLMMDLRADTIKEAINLYEEISYREQTRAAFADMSANIARFADAEVSMAKSIRSIAKSKRK